ncbi:unannotated protein [freshwater metagenome]|uniref:Unannotated protein n=1 Tax=freshwater metagenome TaxID=449393 RepID=A0A6J7DPK6_9ZZZZ
MGAGVQPETLAVSVWSTSLVPEIVGAVVAVNWPTPVMADDSDSSSKRLGCAAVTVTVIGSPASSVTSRYVWAVAPEMGLPLRYH